MPRTKVLVTAAGLTLLLGLTASTASAQQNGQGQNKHRQGEDQQGQYQYDEDGWFGPVAATPELDSLTLLGAGLLGAGGFQYVRLRFRRRRSAD
jgi:hypothetical protein